MPVLPYRTIALVAAACFVLGLCFFFGYQTKSYFCEAEGQKAMVEALETAKKQGQLDKKLAEKSVKEITETKEAVNEIRRKVEESVANDPVAGCVIGDDELQYLDEIQSRSKR